MIMKKYDVFISYSRVDYLDENNNVIKGSPLDKIITKFEENKVNYWIDIDGNNTSNQYMAKITKAIDDSKKVLFVSSKNSNGQDSYWPILEISYASEHHKEIIPVRVDNSGFNVNIKLAFAGLDIVEYYKNPEQSIDRLLKLFLENIGEEKPITTMVTIKKLLVYFVMFLVSLFLTFSIMGTVGFGIGYWKTVEDVEDVMIDVISSGRVKIVDADCIKYDGESIKFIYNLKKDAIDIINDDLPLLSFEKITMSATIPLAIDNLLLKVSHVGDKKAKWVLLIGGGIGILCGYTLGEQYGVIVATKKNEDEIVDYFKKEEVKERFLKLIEEYYQ